MRLENQTTIRVCVTRVYARKPRLKWYSRIPSLEALIMFMHFMHSNMFRGVRDWSFGNFLQDLISQEALQSTILLNTLNVRKHTEN
jgi:hypothetical protein